MGLLDSVIGSVTGSKQGSSSSMSPIIKALLLLFAAKAASSYIGGSSKSQGDTGPQPSGAPDAKPGTIQTGILKGLPSLKSIMERFKRGGHDDKIQSWVGPGENKPHGEVLDQGAVAVNERQGLTAPLLNVVQTHPIHVQKAQRRGGRKAVLVRSAAAAESSQALVGDCPRSV